MTLVDQMTESWDPHRYTDDYKSNLMKVIEAKVKAGGKTLPDGKHHARPATNVIDLVSVLQESLREAGRSAGGTHAPKRARRKPAGKTAGHRARSRKAA